MVPTVRPGRALRAWSIRHDLATRGGQPARAAAHDIDHIAVVQADDDVRGRLLARRRRLPPQAAARLSPWPAAGKPFRVLPALCRRDRQQGSAVLVGLSQSKSDFEGSPRRSRPRPTAISLSPSPATMNLTGLTFITRPVVKRRWPASVGRTGWAFAGDELVWSFRLRDVRKGSTAAVARPVERVSIAPVRRQFGPSNQSSLQCHFRTFTPNKVARAKGVVGYVSNVPSSAFASLRSGVPKPSVNQA